MSDEEKTKVNIATRHTKGLSWVAPDASGSLKTHACSHGDMGDGPGLFNRFPKVEELKKWALAGQPLTLPTDDSGSTPWVVMAYYTRHRYAPYNADRPFNYDICGRINKDGLLELAATEHADTLERSIGSQDSVIARVSLESIDATYRHGDTMPPLRLANKDESAEFFGDAYPNTIHWSIYRGVHPRCIGTLMESGRVYWRFQVHTRGLSYVDDILTPVTKITSDRILSSQYYGSLFYYYGAIVDNVLYIHTMLDNLLNTTSRGSVAVTEWWATIPMYTL